MILNDKAEVEIARAISFNVTSRANALDLIADSIDDALIEGNVQYARALMNKTVVAVSDGILPVSAGLLVVMLARPWRHMLGGVYESIFADTHIMYEKHSGKEVADRGMDGLK